MKQPASPVTMPVCATISRAWKSGSPACAAEHAVFLYRTQR
jgi:hypothetical protein